MFVKCLNNVWRGVYVGCVCCVESMCMLFVECLDTVCRVVCMLCAEYV